jgi:hypothetical protein
MKYKLGDEIYLDRHLAETQLNLLIDARTGLSCRCDVRMLLTRDDETPIAQGSDDEVRFWPDGLAINTYMAIVWATHEIGNKC